MNEKYWDEFYKKHHFKKTSSFAKFCLPYIKGKMLEFGCGNCNDLYYFKKHKIECSGVDKVYNNIDVKKIVAGDVHNKCPEYIYTRFFWHVISRDLQLKILKWVKGTLFIEARTTEDKPFDIFGKHKRNLVNVPKLVKDLKDNEFEIVYLKEGKGLSKFRKEDPYLIRVIARKNEKKITRNKISTQT